MGALIIASLFILSEYPRLKLEPPYGDAIQISMGALLISSAFPPPYKSVRHALFKVCDMLRLIRATYSVFTVRLAPIYA